MSTSDNQQSELWLERASRVMPGPQSNFRARAEIMPIIFSSSEGLRYKDVDGKEYIDYALGMGPAIFGHSNQEYFNAVQEQLNRIFSAGSAVGHTTTEIELAEKIVEHIPSAEWVRFCMTGSEANQLAIRLARAYSNRPLFVRFEGHYHGWLDNIFGGIGTDHNPPYPVPSAGDTKGTSPFALQESLKIPWNDADILEAVLEEHHDKIGMVLMEAIMCNFGCCPPRDGYLERVRELCDIYDVVLCFDEVYTGFRVGLDGAQGKYQVTPDLSIFAKAMAGGLPLSAVVGKKNIMQLLREGTVLGGGTFNSFPLAMAAAVTTIDMLERDDQAYYQSVDRIQNILMEGIREVATKHGQPLFLQGDRGVFYLDFLELDIAHTPEDLKDSNTEKLIRFRRHCHDEGVLIAAGSRVNVSGMLTDRDIDDTLAGIDNAIALLD